MKASLISRELIADSVELCAIGYSFDAVVVIVGCDKTIPAGAMALARLNLPGIVLYSGSIAPGVWEGKDVPIQARTSVGKGKKVSVRIHLGGRRIIKKKKK